jgi:hypothetical protein
LKTTQKPSEKKIASITKYKPQHYINTQTAKNMNNKTKQDHKIKANNINVMANEAKNKIKRS